MSESYDMAAGRWSENDLLSSQIRALLNVSPLRSNPDYIRAVADALEIVQSRRNTNYKSMQSKRATRDSSQ